MTTHRTEERHDEMRRRIDVLEAKAQAAGVTGTDSIKHQIDALRQEASAGAAAPEPEHADASETPPRADPSNDKYLDLETRVGALESEVAAGMARGPRDGGSREETRGAR